MDYSFWAEYPLTPPLQLSVPVQNSTAVFNIQSAVKNTSHAHIFLIRNSISLAKIRK